MTNFSYPVNETVTDAYNVLRSIPADLPIPLDDGACEHLENMQMSDVSLWSTNDQEINLSSLSGWNVIFCYPIDRKSVV